MFVLVNDTDMIGSTYNSFVWTCAVVARLTGLSARKTGSSLTVRLFDRILALSFAYI
jgi:hypothetical protein